MEKYLEETLEALYFLFKAWLIYWVYIFGKNAAKDQGYGDIRSFIMPLYIILGVTIFCAGMTGYTPAEGRDYDDNGNDDGLNLDYIEPTWGQVAQRAVFVFTILIVPAACGFYNGLKEKKADN